MPFEHCILSEFVFKFEKSKNRRSSPRRKNGTPHMSPIPWMMMPSTTGTKKVHLNPRARARARKRSVGCASLENSTLDSTSLRRGQALVLSSTLAVIIQLRRRQARHKAKCSFAVPFCMHHSHQLRMVAWFCKAIHQRRNGQLFHIRRSNFPHLHSRLLLYYFQSFKSHFWTFYMLKSWQVRRWIPFVMLHQVVFMSRQSKFVGF